MNKISIARYPKDLIKITDKFVRYRICNSKKYYPHLKQSDSHGKAVFCYDFGDGLTIQRINYQFDKRGDNKPFFNISNKSGFYKIKYKNGRLNVYKIFKNSEGKNKIRNVSNKIGNIDIDIFNIKKLFPIYRKRLNRIIVNFLRRHKIKFKYSSSWVENLTIACYPGIKGLKIGGTLSSSYSRFLRQPNIKYAIKKCFGYDSKKLVKMVCGKIEKDGNLNILYLGRVLKGLIPLDYYYQLENINYHYLTAKCDSFGLKLKEVRKLLKNFNSQRLLKLFTAADFATFNFDDSVRLYQVRAMEDGFNLPRQAKHWTEVHNAISPPRPVHLNGRLYNPEIQHFDLPVREKYKEIDGKEIDNFKFEVPKNTKDLEKYSNKLNNCIRGYGQSVMNGMNILAIYKNSQLKYNISIQSREIGQFKGIYNENPPEEDKKKIIDILVNKDIIRKEVEFKRENPAVFQNEPVLV